MFKKVDWAIRLATVVWAAPNFVASKWPADTIGTAAKTIKIVNCGVI